MAIRLLNCLECGTTLEDATEWRVVRVDDPEDQDARPELGFYCARCAAQARAGLTDVAAATALTRLGVRPPSSAPQER